MLNFQKKQFQRNFVPTEVIFAATGSCNLSCPHCYVEKKATKLDIDAALKFLATCKDSTIEKIGFSGGEPFLYPEFLKAVCAYAVEQDFLFDRIMTNGCWWKNELQLRSVLLELWNSNFDGKFGLSFDSFHGQPVEKIAAFCDTVFSVWNNKSVIEIQSVVNKAAIANDIAALKQLAQTLGGKLHCKSKKKDGTGFFQISDGKGLYISVCRTPVTYDASQKEAWKSACWFKEDYCSGPGNVLFVHPDGNIAPCCGFANETPKLYIGNITESFEQVMQNAANNKMVQQCFVQGLSVCRAKMQKEGIAFPGRTADNCTFCQYISTFL